MVAVFGAERKDEVGDIARTMQVFKDNALERERLRKEQEAEQKAKGARAEAVARMIQRFDAEVSGALQIVTSSSTELEATDRAIASSPDETSRHETGVSSHPMQSSPNLQQLTP